MKLADRVTRLELVIPATVQPRMKAAIAELTDSELDLMLAASNDDDMTEDEQEAVDGILGKIGAL